MASKRCPHCNLVNPASAERCDCGRSFVDGSLGANLESRMARQTHETPRTSGMAIAGFVLSFFCTLLGLIFSILGYNECKRSNGVVSGKGFAIAGIVISIANVVIGLLWFLAIHSNR
jgi:hypothetical protein